MILTHIFFGVRFIEIQGRMTVLLRDFTHAIEIYPDYTVAYYYRGETELRQGRTCSTVPGGE